MLMLLLLQLLLLGDTFVHALGKSRQPAESACTTTL